MNITSFQGLETPSTNPWNNTVSPRTSRVQGKAYGKTSGVATPAVRKVLPRFGRFTAPDKSGIP